MRGKRDGVDGWMDDVDDGRALLFRPAEKKQAVQALHYGGGRGKRAEVNIEEGRDLRPWGLADGLGKDLGPRELEGGLGKDLRPWGLADGLGKDLGPWELEGGLGKRDGLQSLHYSGGRGKRAGYPYDQYEEWN